MEIVASEAYAEMALTYQCIVYDRLNNILKKHGIADVAVRRAICEDYVYESGIFLDQYWFKSEAGPVFPQLCFAERSPGPNPFTGEIERLHVPEAFEFHEAAFGNADYYFDDQQEDASDIELGTGL